MINKCNYSAIFSISDKTKNCLLMRIFSTIVTRPNIFAQSSKRFTLPNGTHVCCETPSRHELNFLLTSFRAKRNSHFVDYIQTRLALFDWKGIALLALSKTWLRRSNQNYPVNVAYRDLKKDMSTRIQLKQKCISIVHARHSNNTIQK